MHITLDHQDFEAAFEAQIRTNNITVTWFNNTMLDSMTSMCPKDVGEDITNWLLNIKKPRQIKVKEFIICIKEINRFLPFLPPLLNASLKQEELFSIIEKSIRSFERLFCTNSARTTITNSNQLESCYMDLEEVNPPSNNQHHGCENICQNNRPLNHHHEHVSNKYHNNQQKISNNQNGNYKWCHFHKSTSHNWAECSKKQRQRSATKG